MHTFFKLSTLPIFLCGAIVAFDQLPDELLTKIISSGPEIIGVLSSTCTRINTVNRTWANTQGKDIAALYTKKIPQYIYFMLKHNKNITECAVAAFTRHLYDSTSLKATSAVYPWIEQKESYKYKSCTSSFDYSCTGPVINGFFMPLCYRRDKATPMMHYLAKEFVPSALHALFKRLLESGLNPYCKFEDKTIFDQINETPGYDQHKSQLTTLCKQYVRNPIDPKVVMYWKDKALTIEDIEKYVCGE